VILELFLALRFLREGRGQSVLILAGVSVGVAVMVFLSALIDGLQQRIIGQTLGTQAHVVVRMPEESVRPLLEPGAGQVVARVVQEPAQRTRSIVGWQRHLEAIERMPGVDAVSATVSGPGFALRGAASRSVVVFGVEPPRFDRIFAVSQHMQAGDFAPSGTDVVVGTELADDLGVEVGDRIRLATVGDRERTFRIAGIFDLGNRDVNRRWAIVSLRAGQTMLDLVGGATSLDVRVRDVFAADEVAARIASRTGLDAESWMQTNQQLMVALRSQSSSSQTIQAFVILAVAMGIASVLVVSVVQKQREIGILRAMGLSRAHVQRVFLVQGLLVGLVGSSFGSAMGAGLVLVFASAARNPDGSPLFLLALEPPLFVTATVLATLVGLLAAAWPARRAARLDPAEAIRHV
jgi:lipoprotein-releasing system permease protein